ncbi:retropepsin-like aspartic protease [Chitinophaga sp. Cy-1792]|uniref:retropepsin-like aspartic protease n=1 Tax=Chitinophaga sp. Cy-1792 TaxID=2608339 RepID=UPI00141FA49A|nr:retropepsin-like aspartic protease [Chitinophaga sp. Cy-1792]NIG55035.1 hypothetical protein [Chitinophaga sp. Cy-1792]
MRYTFSFIFLLVSATASFAQRVTFNKGGTSSKNYYEEISYEYTNGVMFVTPEINGIKRKFLFDTGAPLQITDELYNELKPEIINHTEITDATGNKDRLNIVAIANLKLNNLSFTGVPALVTGSSMYKCWQVDGVIGSNLLRNCIVQIIPAKHLIILTDDETKLSLNKKMQTTLETGEPQSYPFFMVQLTEKETLKIGFDTGMSDFLRLTAAHAKRLEKDGIIEKISSGYGINRMSLLGLAVPDSLFRMKVSRLGIAGCNFTNIIAETGNGRNTRVGSKLLDYGTVTIDFIHHYFYFEPTTDHTDRSEKLLPLRPIIADNKLVAGMVWGTLKDEVKTGDQIMSIDGEPCETMDFCAWLNDKADWFMKKQTATLTIKEAQGNLKKISLSRE